MFQGFSLVFSGLIGGLIGAGIIGTINLWINYRQRKREASKGFLDESLLLLSRAYETFTLGGTSPPVNDPLFWLSTARMIVRFQKMRQRLSERDHDDIADEHEEYWRLKFYTLLKKYKQNLTLKYWAPSGDIYKDDVVPRRAIAVIFDFTKWKDEMPDPLDTVNSKELFARGVVPINFFGLIDFLEQYKQYWADVMQLQKSGKEKP